MKSERTASEVDQWMRERFSMEWSWQRVFKELPAFLGVELSPERPAAEQRPEWWGKPVELSEEGGCLRVNGRLESGIGRVPDFQTPGIREGVIANRRALVIAYEAARKAGVLPGLEGPAPGEAAKGWFGRVPLRVADDGLVWTDEGEAQGLIDLHRFGVGLENRKLLVESYNRWLAAKQLLEKSADDLEGATCRCPACRALRILRGEEAR